MLDLKFRSHDDKRGVARAARAARAAEPLPASSAGVLAPQMARVLAMQRSAGNAAVALMLAGRRPPPARLVVARDPVATPDAAAPTGTSGAPPSQLADLAQRAGSAAGLRAMVVANPALSDQIVAYLRTTDDPALNALMAQAFAPATPSADPAAQNAPAAGPGAAVAKNPVDPTVPLPAPIPGKKTLAKGEMEWTLKPVSHTAARVDVEFKPDTTKVEAKTISYGQTVTQQVGGTSVYPENDPASHTPIEDPATKKRMDQFVRLENDPFYGAEWDQGAKKWKREAGTAMKIGSSTKGAIPVAATMDDTPNVPMAREGRGDVLSEFETVPMVLETREPLGALTWGFKIKDTANAPLELTGATDADCTETPSADWGAAMDKYYAGKYAEILDDFEIAKADLKADHKAKLDGIVTKMKATLALKAQLGGAADLTGDPRFNQALSLKRAQAARDYLVGEGIDAARLELQSYGADWARVEAVPGASEGKNRRVQIWLH